jgi:hypothetical protein
VTSRPAAAQHLRDLAWLRRDRDRIDREYAQPAWRHPWWKQTGQSGRDLARYLGRTQQARRSAARDQADPESRSAGPQQQLA